MPRLRGAVTLLVALLLLAHTGSAARAQEDGDAAPPDRSPPDARFGTGGVSFPVGGLSLPQGLGVPFGASAARPGVTTIPITTAFDQDDEPPPDRLPAGARLSTGQSVRLPASGLSLAPGFGVAATTTRVAQGAVAATTITAASEDDGEPPPARLPAGARLGSGTSVRFGEAGVSLGATALATGLASTDLGGMAMREEADGSLRFTLGADILFDFDKATLRPEAEPVLRKLVAEVAGRTSVAMYRVEGHTDSKGSDAYNDRLSRRRATSVRDWIAKSGRIEGGLVTASGFGERQPVAPNTHPDGSDDPEGRQRNRRVEIVVTPAR